MLALTSVQSTSYPLVHEADPLTLGRPFTEKATETPFGKVVDSLIKAGKGKVSRATIARELNVSKSYVGMWCRGDAAPGFKTAFEIRDWAKKKGKKVPVESWEPYVQR